MWASGAAQRGYAVEYPRISLHAISREESEQFPRPCIYCQVDAGGETRELRLIPHDAEQRARYTPGTPCAALGGAPRLLAPPPCAVEPIFTAMCQCAELHPDPGALAADAVLRRFGRRRARSRPLDLLMPAAASDDEGGEGAEGDDAFQVGPSGFITAETLTAMEAGGDGLDEEVRGSERGPLHPRRRAGCSYRRRCPQRAAILERLDAVLDDSAVAGEAGAADAGADATDDGQFDDA